MLRLAFLNGEHAAVTLHSLSIQYSTALLSSTPLPTLHPNFGSCLSGYLGRTRWKVVLWKVQVARYWRRDCNPKSTGCTVFLASSQISLFLIWMILQRGVYLLDLSLRHRKKKKASKMMLSKEEGGSWWSGNPDRWGEQPQWYSFTGFQSSEALRLRRIRSGCCFWRVRVRLILLLLLFHAELCRTVEMR